MNHKPPKDPRKDRLAKQLRANLQRRKEQARERSSDDADTAGAVEPDRDQPLRGSDTGKP
ncbi:hypothetical protein [Mesorhizobium sp. Z1-4]|uniref:hypothetical protein n=1 Tax=Mesorhizobium sp. Z1-4 TaxID=2448478 RepID=UPI000FDB2567|nr:hypothetical protein [Mesorhizobium sp. Z1-4]